MRTACVLKEQLHYSLKPNLDTGTGMTSGIAAQNVQESVLLQSTGPQTVTVRACSAQSYNKHALLQR
jgi:hypothetical protein